MRDIIYLSVAAGMTLLAGKWRREPALHSLLRIVDRNEFCAERKYIRIVVFARRSDHIEFFAGCVDLFACRTVIHDCTYAAEFICHDRFTLPGGTKDDRAALYALHNIARYRPRRRRDDRRIIVIGSFSYAPQSCTSKRRSSRTNASNSFLRSYPA